MFLLGFNPRSLRRGGGPGAPFCSLFPVHCSLFMSFPVPVPDSIHQFEGADGFFAHGQPFDQIGAHLVAAARCVGNRNLAGR